MDQNEIIDIARQFRSELQKNGFRVERVILFGSYSRGSADPWSDIDIAVVSPDFGKDRFLERVSLAKISSRIDLRIEPYPVGSHEFEKEAWKMMIHEIRSNGIEIAA